MVEKFAVEAPKTKELVAKLKDFDLNDVLIVENIKGADQLLDKDFDLYVSPLKMRTGGSFSRVFAQIK